MQAAAAAGLRLFLVANHDDSDRKGSNRDHGLHFSRIAAMELGPDLALYRKWFVREGGFEPGATHARHA
jgi:hypothetical protein